VAVEALRELGGGEVKNALKMSRVCFIITFQLKGARIFTGCEWFAYTYLFALGILALANTLEDLRFTHALSRHIDTSI
jgi:hypothetical protein